MVLDLILRIQLPACLEQSHYHTTTPAARSCSLFTFLERHNPSVTLGMHW